MKRLLVLPLAGLLGLLTVLATTAGADAPTQQGWWTATNSGGIPPALTAGPDVPAKGLLVQGGNQSPSAYAALVFQVAQGAKVGALTLKVAPNTITTPGSTLRVCPLAGPTISAEQGGPMSHAPRYDCARQTTASPQGNDYHFDVASLVSSNALAVAVLPTTRTDRVVFAQPDSSALAVQTVANLSEVTTSPAADVGGTALTSPLSAPAPAVGVPTPLPAVAPTLAAGAIPAAAASPVLAAPPQGNPAPAQQSTAGFLPTHSNGKGSANPAAVAAVLAAVVAAGGLWFSAGRSATRAAIAADASADAGADDADTGE